MKRRLLSTRRRVALDQVDDYLLAWLALRRAVEATGARAWIFRGVGHEDVFMEFVEWGEAGGEPLRDEAVQAALTQLDAFGPTAPGDEWEEAT